MSAGSTPSSAFTMAAAPLIDASAAIMSRESGSPDISKFCTARWVWAPHSASAGTATSPIESCSIRKPAGMSAMTASGSARSRADVEQRQLRCGSVRPVLASKKVVALVVHHDEGREVAYFDPPDGFHAEFRVLQDLDLGNAVPGELGGGAADRAEVEAAVLLAGRRDCS